MLAMRARGIRMLVTRSLSLLAAFAIGISLSAGSVSAQTESASAEDGAPASDAPAETNTAPSVPIGANLAPPIGLPPVPALITGPGSGQPGSSSVSMAPGIQTTGIAREGINAVRAPEANAAPPPVSEAAPAPVGDTALADTSEAVVTDTAIATETDRDADNYADALEWEIGLDPNNADTDADNVADGDELNIYGTEPTVFDTDGDGLSDGEELFGTLTDPLVFTDLSAGGESEAVAQETMDSVPSVE